MPAPRIVFPNDFNNETGRGKQAPNETGRKRPSLAEEERIINGPYARKKPVVKPDAEKPVRKQPSNQTGKVTSVTKEKPVSKEKPVIPELPHVQEEDEFINADAAIESLFAFGDIQAKQASKAKKDNAPDELLQPSKEKTAAAETPDKPANTPPQPSSTVRRTTVDSKKGNTGKTVLKALGITTVSLAAAAGIMWFVVNNGVPGINGVMKANTEAAVQEEETELTVPEDISENGYYFEPVDRNIVRVYQEVRNGDVRKKGELLYTVYRTVDSMVQDNAEALPDSSDPEILLKTASYIIVTPEGTILPSDPEGLGIGRVLGYFSQ